MDGDSCRRIFTKGIFGSQELDKLTKPAYPFRHPSVYPFVHFPLLRECLISTYLDKCLVGGTTGDSPDASAS